MHRSLYSPMAALSLTATLAACADEPTRPAAPARYATPSGPSLFTSVYDVSVDPAYVYFGKTIYRTSKTDTVTVTNAGSNTANINVYLGGLNPGDFNTFIINGTTPDCESSLGPGATCVIGVQFTPQEVGPREAVLSIGVNGTPLSVSLSGEGIRAALDYSPLSMMFGDEAVGTTSYPRLLTISNTGTADLQVWSIKLQGSNPGDFVVSQPSTNACVQYAPIAPNASCDITVAFAPIASGTRSAYLVVETVDSNGAMIGTATVLLVGNGTGVISNPDADLAVSIGGAPNQVQVGKTFTYNITVKNAGPGAAAGIALSATVPVGTGFAGITAPTGVSCVGPAKGDAGGVSCSIGSMASGSAFTVKLAVTALSGNRMVISNTATVTSTSVDPVKGNDSATATTTIVGRKGGGA